VVVAEVTSLLRQGLGDVSSGARYSMAEQRPHERHGIYGCVLRCLSTCKGKEVVKTARKHIDLVGRCKKTHEFPRNDPPGRTRFRADGTRHSSFEGAREWLRLLSESIDRSIPRLPCHNASVSASTSMAFGRIHVTSGTRDKKRRKAMPSKVSG
jgi:hypothetical protein